MSNIGKKVLCLTLLLVAYTAMGSNAAKRAMPMIINASWTSPDTRFLKLHTADMELRPFTGVAAYVSWPTVEAGGVDNSSGTGSLSWAVFESTRFTSSMLQTAETDIQTTTFTRFRDNFMWIVSYVRDGGAFNWFDDARWATVCGNARDLARLGRIGNYKGVFFDGEEYGCAFWSWIDTRPGYSLRDYPIYSGKTYQQVRDKVRQRGREFITAINQDFPGCTFWMTFGYSHFIRGLPLGADLSDKNASLYAAFIDGMLEASDAKTMFVDGGEPSYRYNDVYEFEYLRKVIAEDALTFTQVPDIYKKKMHVGFGLYMDMYQNSPPWNSENPEANVMTPAMLEKAIRNALAVGDGYVWIYNEFPTWWLDSAGEYFPTGVRCRSDHKWIHPAYWRSIELAQTVAYYSENFDGSGVTSGQSVRLPPFNWTETAPNSSFPNQQIFLRSGLHGFTGNFLDGSTATDGNPANGNYARLQANFATQASSKLVVWRAKVYPGPVSSVDARSCNIRVGNTKIGWGWPSTNTWSFTADDVATTNWTVYNTGFYGAIVELTVGLDFRSGKVWGTISGPGGVARTPEFDLSVSGLSSPSQVNMWGTTADLRGGVEQGYEFDDVTVSSLPSVLTGHVDFEDYVGSNWLAPVQIQLIQNSLVVRTERVFLDDSGDYCLTNIDSGAYDMVFSANKCLTQLVSSLVVGTDRTECDVSLPNGDADGDNQITSTDISIILTNNNKTGD